MKKKDTSETTKKKHKYFITSPGLSVTEKFKGEVQNDIINFPKDLGVEHPFDFNRTEKLYKDYGFVTGIVDKYVDFIVGPGFFIKTKNAQAKKIIEDFMRDVNFDTIDEQLKYIAAALIFRRAGTTTLVSEPEDIVN